MAKAILYDQFEDPGMGFSADEVAAFNPAQIPTERAVWLLENVKVIERHLVLPEAAKPKWWGEVRKVILARLGRDYGRIGTVSPESIVDALVLPSADSDEGKALTVRAIRLEPQAFIDEWHASVLVALRRHVTLGRRAVPVQSKEERSRTNVLTERIRQELLSVEKLREKMTLELSAESR